MTPAAPASLTGPSAAPLTVVAPTSATAKGQLRRVRPPAMAASAAPRPRSLPSPAVVSDNPARPAGSTRPGGTTRPGLASTTHTTELTQLAVLNRKLENPPEGDPITAGDLGLPDELVPNTAVLVALRWEGPPEYPYIHGRFSTGAPDQLVNANLHTPALREISTRLGVRQIWGT